MKLTCLLGRHWPVAAFSPVRDGSEQSKCVDCGAAMEKSGRADWRLRTGAAA